MPPYRVPSAQRVAALREATAIPDEFERHYLAALERGATLENAAKLARAAVEAPASDAGAHTGANMAATAPPPTPPDPAPEPLPATPPPPRLEDLRPPLDLGRPWYNPDPRHISSARRVIRPAVWVTSIIIGLQMIGTVTGYLFEGMGLGYWTMLTIMSVMSIFMALLMKAAWDGSPVAAYVLLAIHTQPVIRTIQALFDALRADEQAVEAMASGLGLTLSIGLALLWAAAGATLTHYKKSLRVTAMPAPRPD
tara:strand:+ start:1688 stop:2446 length:759 start_codon:yes stop_codon:yes gene_type:complete